jgi:type I restriction enzyme, S subunit
LKFNTCHLANIAEIFSGYAFKSKDLSDSGIPVIKIANIQNNRVLKECQDFLPEDLLSTKLTRYFLQDRDCLVAMTGAGSVGKFGKMFRQNDNKYIVNQRVGIIRPDPSVCDPKFVFYVLSNDIYEKTLYGLGLGAGQPNVSAKQIGTLIVPFPPLPTQRKIASILSAYDDLIENNLRRIKILEEMAQNLYREWFVKFHFPGHENVRFVDSPLGRIPEGWEVKRLGDLVELAYGKGLKKEDRISGNIPVYGSGGIVGYHNSALVEGPGIIVGRKGNVGSIFWSSRNFFPIDTVFYVITHVDLHYTYYNLSEQNFINTDAAVPGLSRNQAYSNSFLFPSNDVLSKFGDIIKLFFNLIDYLKIKSQNLRQTRDILLPKLISGEVDVSELDVTIPEENL